MRKNIKVHLVDAFTKNINEGNRAGVVFDADELTSEQMQNIAAFANVSETAFVLRSDDPKTHDLHVRYFTPKTEVPICGHATIATHYLRAKKYNIGEGQVLSKTGAGILPVDIVKENNDIKIIMTQGKSVLGNVLTNLQRDFLKNSLQILDDDFSSSLPIQIVSTGHSKVMVPVRNQSVVQGISPDQDGLIKLSEEIDCNGYYVFSVENDEHTYKTHGRMFAPAIGIFEDPVTGNANGPAGLYMSHYGILQFDKNYNYKAIQGEAMGKSGVIEVILNKEKDALPQVKVAGVAIEGDTLVYAL
ncbi:MAG: hypothetical protein COB14_09635 [Alphaproteobacteria bacterium]|nr:MAG: hypothetical protein COB14_09635 [Alphaproteobacteria bacterium]